MGALSNSFSSSTFSQLQLCNIPTFQLHKPSRCPHPQTTPKNPPKSSPFKFLGNCCVNKLINLYNNKKKQKNVACFDSCSSAAALVLFAPRFQLLFPSIE